VNVCLCVYMHFLTPAAAQNSACVSMYVYTHTDASSSAKQQDRNKYVCICVCVCVHMCTCVCMCVWCVFVYISMYTHRRQQRCKKDGQQKVERHHNGRNARPAYFSTVILPLNLLQKVSSLLLSSLLHLPLKSARNLFFQRQGTSIAVTPVLPNSEKSSAQYSIDRKEQVWS